ncbi:MAG: nitroreductase family protein [Clostridiales bacterium]|nr:nitroreductase family protein [Clostridiales bacterium]
MNVIEAINTRRSIRQYTGEVINDKHIDIILRAGFQAPSAHDFQPQEYIVVKESETLGLIAKRHKYAKALPLAGCGIVVCGDTTKESREGSLIAGCSASIQNMLLTAHELNLGAVWIGLHPIESFTELISEILDIPDHIIPIAIVAIGHPDVKKEAIDRYNKEKIHKEKW